MVETVSASRKHRLSVVVRALGIPRESVRDRRRGNEDRKQEDQRLGILIREISDEESQLIGSTKDIGSIEDAWGGLWDGTE